MKSTTTPKYPPHALAIQSRLADKIAPADPPSTAPHPARHLSFFAFILLIIAIATAVNLVQQRQELRSQAQEPATTLSQ